MRTAGFLGKTLMGLLHGIDRLCPEEQMLWEAYYALNPYDPTTKALINVTAAIRKVDPIYPAECKLNQPIEDIKPFSLDNRKRLIAKLNAAVAMYGIKMESNK